MTASTEETKPVDVEAILPEVQELTVGGVPVEVNRLKLRGFLALMNIITTGVGQNLGSVDFSADQEEMAGNLMALVVMAVPNAVDETVDFVRVVVSPVAKNDKTAQRKLNEALEDPELDEFMDVLAAVIEQEAPEFQALLGKGKAHLQRIQSLFRKNTN